MGGRDGHRRLLWSDAGVWSAECWHRACTLLRLLCLRTTPWRLKETRPVRQSVSSGVRLRSKCLGLVAHLGRPSVVVSCVRCERRVFLSVPQRLQKMVPVKRHFVVFPPPTHNPTAMCAYLCGSERALVLWMVDTTLWSVFWGCLSCLQHYASCISLCRAPSVCARQVGDLCMVSAFCRHVIWDQPSPHYPWG